MHRVRNASIVKSFRIYISPGRVPIGAGWVAVLTSLAVVFAGLFHPTLWMKFIVADRTSIAKWALVFSGLVTFGLVGGLLKLFGKPLSRLESEK